MLKEIEAKARSQPLLVDRLHSSKPANNLDKIKAMAEYINIRK